MKRPSQTQLILDYLAGGETLTPLLALEKFGCFRLAARINELRVAGHPIETDIIRTAAGSDIAQYYYNGVVA